jgi:hypothetical protein
VKLDCEEQQIITDSVLDDINSRLSSTGCIILKATYGMDIASPQDPVSRLNVQAMMGWLTFLPLTAFSYRGGNPRANKPRS